ncbi:MAG: type II secretion system F family protein [Planctomycetaceae bacterium]|nr:type II secretion system F family protein [Planctomycetaceae bacterium]
MDPMLLSIAAFIAVAALVGAVAFLMNDFGASRAEERLNEITGRGGRGDGEGVLRQEIMREGMEGALGMFSGLAERLQSLALLFEQSNSPIKPATFFGISLGAAVLGFVVSLVARSPAPLYPVAALMGGSMPTLWLLLRRRARFKKFAMQLPDALELIGRALRSGHSLSSGLHVVVEEMPAPISVEFGNAFEEQNLGVPIEQSLKNMLKRMPNLDLKFFVTAVAIQRQAGGDLAEILDKIGGIIRERFKILGQVQALTGEGRISGVVLMGLPVALFLAVYHLNPDYVKLLFTDELGRKMIAAAVVLQIVGAITIKKIVNIKV